MFNEFIFQKSKFLAQFFRSKFPSSLSLLSLVEAINSKILHVSFLDPQIRGVINPFDNIFELIASTKESGGR